MPEIRLITPFVRQDTNSNPALFAAGSTTPSPEFSAPTTTAFPSTFPRVVAGKVSVNDTGGANTYVVVDPYHASYQFPPGANITTTAVADVGTGIGLAFVGLNTNDTLVRVHLEVSHSVATDAAHVGLYTGTGNVPVNGGSLAAFTLQADDTVVSATASQRTKVAFEAFLAGNGGQALGTATTYTIGFSAVQAGTATVYSNSTSARLAIFVQEV